MAFENNRYETGDCAIGTKYFQPPGFYVSLENFENMFNSDRYVYTVANQYYRDMLIQINFFGGAYVSALVLRRSGAR